MEGSFDLDASLLNQGISLLRRDILHDSGGRIFVPMLSLARKIPNHRDQVDYLV